MSFPQVHSLRSSSDASGTDHEIDISPDISAGDLLVVVFASDGNPTVTFPAGWYQLFQTAYSSYVKLGVWYRIADGEEGDTITVTTSASEGISSLCYRITGYSGVPEVGTAVTSSGSTTPNPPSLSPAWGALDTLWLACCANDDGTNYITAYPANYPIGNNNEYPDNSAGCGVATAFRELNADTEDPGTFTIDGSEQWVANTVAVKPVLTPTVTTADASDVEETTATTGGEITATGGGNATRRGVKYGLTTGSRTWDSYEDGDFGAEAFERDLTGLTKGELYYFEAYATNSAGTSYGDEKTFLTKPDEPTNLDAVPGDEHIYLTWDRGTGYDKTMLRFRTDGVYPTDPADGTETYFGAGDDYDHVGLTNGLTYKYRAWSYATEGGLEQYSDLYSSDEATPIGPPFVTTNEASYIEIATAILNGSITDIGVDTPDFYGFVWDTESRGDPGDTDPIASDYTGSFKSAAGSYGVDDYDHAIDSLLPSKTYYFRFCAHNSEGWNYGDELDFVTKAVPGIYTIEIHDLSGNLVAILEKAYKITLDETINAVPALSFSIPIGDSKASTITRGTEIWVKDVANNILVVKTRLLRRDDIR
jgi:hypothetical protein